MALSATTITTEQTLDLLAPTNLQLVAGAIVGAASELLSGQLEHRGELPILLALLDEASERAAPAASVRPSTACINGGCSA